MCPEVNKNIQINEASVSILAWLAYYILKTRKYVALKKFAKCLSERPFFKQLIAERIQFYNIHSFLLTQMSYQIKEVSKWLFYLMKVKSFRTTPALCEKQLPLEANICLFYPGEPQLSTSICNDCQWVLLRYFWLTLLCWRGSKHLWFV